MSPNKSVVSPDTKGIITSSRSAGDNLPDCSPPKFTPKQDAAIELLADFEVTMTRDQIARAIGVTRRTILTWSKMVPGWHQEIARRVRLRNDRLFVMSIRGLARVMRYGEDAPVVSAARTALQYCGDLSGDGVHVHQETHVAVGSAADRINKYRIARGLAPLRLD